MEPNSPYPQNQPPQAPQPANDYSFIVNPDTPQPTGKSFGGASSPIARALIVLAGFVVLIILFSVVKGVLNSGSTAPLYLGLLQDQQSMIHITDLATKEPSITKGNKDFAYNANLSLFSDQRKTISYIKNTGTKKIDEKQVNLKVSPTLDQQLTDAAAASNYNTVFPQIMKAKLTNYDQALQNTYNKTKGKNGRALLKSEHNNTVLLIKQLEAANK